MRNYTVETFVDRMGSPPIPEAGISRMEITLDTATPPEAGTMVDISDYIPEMEGRMRVAKVAQPLATVVFESDGPLPTRKKVER